MSLKKSLSAARWAARYYSGEQLSTATPARTAALMEKAFGVSPVAKEGIGHFIAPHANSDSWLNRDEVLESLKAASDAGHGMAMLHALWLCFALSPEEPVPPWIRGAMLAGITGWRNYTWGSLEEAFRAKRPRGKAADRHWFAMHYGQILVDYAKARAANVACNRTLYEEIGRAYNRSGATIERIIEEFERSRSARTKRQKSAG